MIFKEIVDSALEQAGHSKTDDNSEARPRIEGFTNQYLQRLTSQARFDHLRRGTIPFSSVANTSRVSLPPIVARIDRIYETTNNNRLIEKTLDWLRQKPQAGVSGTGTPQYYIPMGITAIYKSPPAAGSTLFIKSSSALDTTQKVSVNAVRAAGYKYEIAPTTLNGNAFVQLGARSDFIDVLTFSVSDTCVGDIAVWDATTELGVIPIGQFQSRYFTIFLWPIPASAITYYVESELRFQKMIRPYDEPMIPEDFHDMLIRAAVYYETLLIKKQIAVARSFHEDEILPRENELLDYLINNPDYLPVPRSAREAYTNTSNLGSMYPSGVW